MYSSLVDENSNLSSKHILLYMTIRCSIRADFDAGRSEWKFVIHLQWMAKLTCLNLQGNEPGPVTGLSDCTSKVPYSRVSIAEISIWL